MKDGGEEAREDDRYLWLCLEALPCEGEVAHLLLCERHLVGLLGCVLGVGRRIGVWTLNFDARC